MEFATALSFNDTHHFLDMARTADGAGWDWFAVSDHVAFPEKLESAYPYAPDGKAYWPKETDWPDPWVAIAGMAAVTERLRFVTNVYVLPARHPVLVAKSVGTAAVISGGRVVLGIGVGWMREEFELIGQDFSGRGRRTNEAIEILRALWKDGRTAYSGKKFEFEEIHVRPKPDEAVPIFVGGVSEPALKRAARYGDGWISVAHSTAELQDIVTRLNTLRAEYGRQDEPFHIMAACNDAFDVDGYKRLEELGVNSLMTQPWLFYGADPNSLEEKCDSLKRFADDVILPMKG